MSKTIRILQEENQGIRHIRMLDKDFVEDDGRLYQIHSVFAGGLQLEEMTVINVKELEQLYRMAREAAVPTSPEAKEEETEAA